MTFIVLLMFLTGLALFVRLFSRVGELEARVRTLELRPAAPMPSATPVATPPRPVTPEPPPPKPIVVRPATPPEPVTKPVAPPLPPAPLIRLP